MTDKVYCRDCQYHIEYSEAIRKLVAKESEDGENICGASLNTHINFLGDEVISLAGVTHYCEECGSPLADNRRPVYRKCAQQNSTHECKLFLQKTRMQKLKSLVNSAILQGKTILRACSLSGKSAVIYVVIYSVAFLLWFDLLKFIESREIAIYLSIALPAMLYVYYKAR